MVVVKIFFILTCVKLTVLGMAAETKKLCSYDDEDCLTKSTRIVYKKIITGKPGQVEASDPLHKDVIELDLPNLKYTMKDATMNGLLKCDVEDVLVNQKQQFFNYQILCPELQIESNYQVNGNLDKVSVDGAGSSKITYTDYEILLTGYYGKYLDPSGDLHTNITKFEIEVSTKALTHNFAGIKFDNKDGEDAQVDNLEKIIRTPMMNSFIEKYIKNLDDYLKIVPIKDIHYQVIDS